MASEATQSASYLPAESSPKHVTEIYMKDLDEEKLSPALKQSTAGHNEENGNVRAEKNDHWKASQAQKGKGFETFLMTGEMIIHTNPAVTQKIVKKDGEVKTAKGSQIPRLGQIDQKQPQHHSKSAKPHPQQQGVIVSPKLHSKIPGLVKNHNAQQSHSSSSHQSQLPPQNVPHLQTTEAKITDFPFIQAPVAEVEELSDLSQSSCSESELGLENGSTTQSPSLPMNYNLESPPKSSNTLRLQEAMETLGKLQATLLGNNTIGLSDTSISEPPSSGDSGFVYDGHISDPDLTDRGYIHSEYTLAKGENFVSDETLTGKEVTSVADNLSSDVEQSSSGWAESTYQGVIADSTGEKFNVHGGNTERLLVRTSKSHENYLQAGTGIALVSIDIEDGLAYSLDTLTYHDSPNSSTDNVAAEHQQMSRSLDNSPEKKSEKSLAIEREFIPGFISFEDSKPVKLKFSKQRDDFEDERHNDLSGFKNFGTEFMPASSQSPRFQHRDSSENSPSGDDSFGHLLESSDEVSFQRSVLTEDADSDSLYHQPSKAVDRPSAERLAKRLFNLEGFRKSDVSMHLCKKNDFSNLVAEEYLKFFDFQEDTLDQALRKFLSKFSLYGETQERERVLAHFSRRFMECNNGSFNSEDACHTLTCAIMLLNSDLHAPNISRRMTCQEFIENLAELNDGEDFSKEVLKAIYQSIKNEPLEWAVDKLSPQHEGTQLPEQGGQAQMPIPLVLGNNPFLEIPDPNKTTEYKKGYVMRKCCIDPDRRKTPLGKRGWKMMYAVLRDMILYQYKDEHQLKRGHFVESTHSAIRIHHALATKASDYTKKQHVFRLQTADGAEYLFQTGDSKELQEWVDIINLIAASLSAPVLPGAVGSRAKFQRQLLPSSNTRLNLREQLHSHEIKVQELEQELHQHHAAAPEKGSRSSVIQEYLDKESYLEFEIKRFKTYIYLLQGKLMVFPELEPSLVETTIGEYEEMGAAPTRSMPSQSSMIMAAAKLNTRPVQRSMSDRTISHASQAPSLPQLAQLL